MMWSMSEAVIAITAVLALIVSGAALFVSLKVSREDLQARLEEFQFSWTPLVAVTGGTFGGIGSTRTLGGTVHLEGRGFVHNLIINLFLDGEPVEKAHIAVWNFKQAPATEPLLFQWQVQQSVQGNQLARIEGIFENVFKQQIRFTQRGVIRVSTYEFDVTSGAPEYSWPWTSVQPGAVGRVSRWKALKAKGQGTTRITEPLGLLMRQIWGEYLLVTLGIIGIVSIILGVIFPTALNAFNDSSFMQSYLGKWLFLALILFWGACILCGFNLVLVGVILAVGGIRTFVSSERFRRPSR